MRLQHYYTGRAPLEAASMGIALAPDETAFRCNLVTLDYHDNGRTTMVDFSADHISNAEAAQLITALQQRCGNETFTFHAGISYRHLLVVKDPLTALLTVPPHDFIGKDVTPHLQAYLDTPGWSEACSAGQKCIVRSSGQPEPDQERQAAGNRYLAMGERQNAVDADVA